MLMGTRVSCICCKMWEGQCLNADTLAGKMSGLQVAPNRKENLKLSFSI